MFINFTEAGADSLGSRSEVRVFKAASAITKNRWVAFDLDQTAVADDFLYVEHAPGVATVGSKLAFGVALEDAAAGALVKVCVAGYCAEAYVDGAAVAGSALIGPIGTAGQAAIEAPGTTTGKVCGVALAADTSNVAPVLVVKSV